MLKPAYPAAVVAGNTETSQHVTNCLLYALDALANAQGTMNNLTYGNARYQNYETICSGSPAGKMNSGARHSHGASGVHTHMTNTRMTDPEILEMRYPDRGRGILDPRRLGRRRQVPWRRRQSISAWARSLRAFS
jgi:5-oxoprolinase (ATP-hydrolysing)